MAKKCLKALCPKGLWLVTSKMSGEPEKRQKWLETAVFALEAHLLDIAY